MHDRCQLYGPRDDWPLIRHVALTIAACQLAALLTVGALIWHTDEAKPAGVAIARQATAVR